MAAALRRCRKALLVALTVLLAAGLTLAGLEGLARVLGDRPLRSDTFEEEVWVGDSQVALVRLRSPDTMLVTNLAPNQRKCGGDGCVTINEHGFRRAADAAPWDDPNTIAVAMVGDSFTFGYGVSDGETVAALLEENLHEHGRRDVRVLNFGINGMNSVQASRVVAHRATAFVPKVVIYSYFLNDPEIYWQEGNPALSESLPLFEPAPLHQRLLVRSRLYELVWLERAHRARKRALEGGDLGDYFSLIHRPSWPGMWATGISLDAMKRASTSIGATLLVILLPYEMTAEAARRTTGQIIAMCRDRNIPTLDLLDAYLSRPDRATLWTRHEPRHFNVRGNRLVADEILHYLEATNSLRGSSGGS